MQFRVSDSLFYKYHWETCLTCFTLFIKCSITLTINAYKNIMFSLKLQLYNSTDRFADMHQMESLIDLLQRHIVGYKRIQGKFVCQVLIN